MGMIVMLNLYTTQDKNPIYFGILFFNYAENN
ncbi:hypothetical protein FIC_01719 [Flavobacteriaceae bacterium 3519-10]|nr:hypothetical protein FIC_01719 [Flavobacteriaceae bacterium 3519-10]